MAKNLNMVSLKDTGGLTTEKKTRKENLPDLTTSFANALTQGADSLSKKATSVPTDNSAVASLVGSKASKAKQDEARQRQIRTAPKKQNIGNLNSVAVSSLVGSNATQEERREAALQQNKIMGAANQNLSAQQRRGKGNTAYMLSDIIGQTNGMSSTAIASLTGSNATARDKAKAWNRSTAAADTLMNGEPVHQITDWSTGDPLTNKLVNALDQKAETSWEQADAIEAAAKENYGQYLTPQQQTISNIITNIEDNTIRMGKRMALSFLTGGSALAGVAGDAAMYLSSAGEALKDARDKGFSDDTARKYASIVGMANAGLEHLGDPTGTESYGLGLDEDLSNIIKSAQFLSPKTKWVANWLAGGFEEGLEELMTEALTQWAGKQYLNEDITSWQRIEDRMNAFGMGMISSLFLSGVVQGDMMPSGYQKYAGEIALDYWRMDNADRAEVVNALSKEFNVDPALLQKSIEDHALDAVKYMDGETLMRAIENAPVAIMPDGEGVYEYFGERSSQQEKALKLAARPGNKAYLVETLGTDSKGYAIPSATLDDGTVLISSEVEDPMNGIATHEVVHVVKDPEFIAAAQQAMREIEGSRFDSWLDSLKGAYAPMYTDLASTATNPIQRNQENIEYGRARYESDPVFRQKIDEEVASYFAQYHLLKDQKTFDRFMNRTGNLLQRTIQSLKDNLARTGDQTLVSNLENQYTRMVQNYQKQNRGNFLSRLAGNLNANKLSPQVSYSLKSMGIDLAMGTDSEMVQDLLNTGVFQNQEEATTFVNNVNQLMDLLSQRAFLDMHEEADRDTRAFHPIKKNSDKLYEISLDYSTLCKKRIITQAIIEKLNVERGQALDARTQFAITELLRQYQQQESKLQVACALCYVEAARLKSPKVINQFINDPAKYMTSYFVKQGGSEGKQIVADAQNNFKTMLGVDPKATKTDMADSVAQRMTVGEFNDVLRSIGAAEIDGDPDAMVTPQKVKNAYNNYAVQLRESLTDTLTDDQKAAIELAKSLDRKYYLTAQGLTDLKMGNVNGQYNPLARDIYNAFTNRVTTATRSKAIETDVAYYYGDAKGVSDSLIERMNAENGIRTQSWSDFTMQHLLDEITSTAELATRNAKMHGYTKVPEYVLVKGKTGEMINNSLIPLGRTGFDEYGNLAFSPTEGMPIEESNRLRGIFPNTDGSICIGINDEQIRALLRDDRIDYVIPYHVSGLTSHLRTIAGINKWENYTGTQNETPIPGRKQGAAIKFSDWYTDDIKNQKKPGIEIMMDAQQNYLDLCAERGYIPKFPQFLINNGDGTYSIDPENSNYWKLLIDRKMINQLNGKIIEQKAVRPDFNWEDTYVNGERVPGLFSLVKEAEDPMTTELVERMASVVRNAIDDGTVNAIAENNPNVRGVMDFFIQNNPIEQLGEEDVDEYEWNGDPYDPATRVDVDIQTDVAPPSYYLQTNIGGQHNDIAAAMYSLSDDELDRQYYNAIDRGDNEEAQRLVDQRANERGYTERGYHGTNQYGFTSPNPSRFSDDGLSFFATDSIDTAQTYSGLDTVRRLAETDNTESYEDQVYKAENNVYSETWNLASAISSLTGIQGYVTGDELWRKYYDKAKGIMNWGDPSDVGEFVSEDVYNLITNLGLSMDVEDFDEWAETDASRAYELGDELADLFTNLAKLWEDDTDLGIYDLAINPSGLLNLDGRGTNWNRLDFSPEELGMEQPEGKYYDERPRNTRQLAKYANDHGYSGYRIENLFDDGGRSTHRQQRPSTVYNLFNPQSQVKSRDVYTTNDYGEVIPLSQRFNPAIPDIRYSLMPVDPIQPSSGEWRRDHTTDEVKAMYPDLWDVAAEESETRNPTQVTSTIKSYKKIYDYLRNTGFNGTILDASSGLGLGTELGRNEYGFDVDDIEPYPGANYTPRYTDYSSLNKTYDAIISNAVLNVLPQDQRDALVVKMGQMLNPGGKMFINVRGKDVLNASSKKVIDPDNMEIYISNTGSYQKGFTPKELRAYLQDALGSEYTVEPTRMLNGVAAIVTKNAAPENAANNMLYSLSEDIPEQANAFPDRNYPQDRSAMRMLGQMSRDRVAADPLTYESISPESFPVPDRIQDYIDLMEDEEDRKYGFDEAPEKELSDEDRDMYKSIAGNKSGALQGFATPTQMFNNMMGKEGEQREFFRDRYERPMFDTKKEYNANREQRWQALENIIKETGIEANTPESAAVQWYGEKAKPNEAGETIPYTLADLKKEFPNKWEDIVKMERFMRGMYDEYVGRINAALEQVYPNLEEKAQAQLESWRNKKRIYQDEIEMSRNPVANEYWQNEIAKLDKKIAKLEGDLESGEYFRNKRLNPRQDYFHHFQEVETKGIGGLKNILQASTLIDPQLVGKTEFTKPKSRWMSWLQKRGQGAYTADAVLGMGKYIDSAEYAIAFDPLIAQYRDEISNMVKATRDTKNANQLIQYLSSYTNQLAGKTASLDRTVLDLLGEGNRGQLFNALAAINNRAKSNAVVGNVRSAIAQFFNIPNAMSIIKSNTAWAKGVRDYANAKLGNRELLDQSPFLQERYFDHNVDDLKARNTDWEKITGKIGDITNEMMTFGDREATELIWLAAYNEGIENGVSDPTYYADDLTRQSVAGRGIGEVPYNMKSKVASFFMPFQVETNNQWQNLKGMLKDKDAKGVFRLMLGAYLMNAMVKPLFNDGVLPDIIDVLVQGLRKLFDKDREESVGEIALDTGKRMAGEAVSFIPGTSLWLPAIMSSDSAEALFGDSDPTRYGTGTVGLSTITKTLADALDGDGQFDLMTPLLQLGLPYGGKQASRLYNTLQDMNILPSNGTMNTPFGGEKNPISGDYSKAGALKYQLPEEVDSFGDAAEIARAFLFGSNATNAAQEYFDTLKPVLNKTQVEKLKENPEVDPQTYIDYVHQANVDGKNGISQAEAYNWLSSHDLSDEEKNALWSMTNSAWTKTYDEYTPQNETIVENADTNGDGRVTQAEAYSWLSRQDDISDEEKNAMWAENGWSTSYDKYDKAHKGVLGYNRKTLTEAVDQDGNGMMKQQELYFWLQNQGYTEQEKADLWDLAGWKTDYQSYNNKMKSKAPTTETTRKVKSMDELTGKEAPKSPSGITNRKELLIAADTNNDGYMSQKEAYTYLSGTNLSEEEKEALWNLSNWKTSYQKYAQKNG